jgi:hypothetical protein
MPSEDVLFSITSHHLTLLALKRSGLCWHQESCGFGGTAEIQTEIIGGFLASRPDQDFF